MNKLLGNFKCVEQLKGRNGAVKNQFIIHTDKGTVFQSYDSIIAAKMGNEIWLDVDKWDYSVTTSKYRNRFLGMTTKELRAAIKRREILFTNLNDDSHNW